MANKTNIEWTDFNWNFLRGCSRVSEGCRNCYAEKMAARFSDEGQPYHGIAKRRDFVGDQRSNWTGEISFHEDILLTPLRWTKPRKVFVNSMSDLFHEKVKEVWLDKAFAVMALTPHITYQILTKRPQRMLEYLTAPSVRFPTSTEPRPEISYQLGLLTDVTNKKDIGRKSAAQNRMCNGGWPLPNVWLGVSVEDQKTADERIPLLLQTPASVRWISAEPLLGPVNLEHRPTGFDVVWSNYLTGRDHIEDGREVVDHDVPVQGNKLDWVVVGGESGPRSRPFDVQWCRSIVEQCKAAGVPVFVKQLGANPVDSVSEFGDPDGDEILLTDRKGGNMAEWDAELADLRVRQMPEVQ